MPASISRVRAAEILFEVDQNRAQVNLLLAQIMRDKGLDPRDQNLIQHIVKGTLENRAAIDALLDPLVKGGFASLKPMIQTILRMTVYQLRHLDRIPKEAAVFDAVELTKNYGSQGVAGLVNGVLRSLLRKPELLEIKPIDLATETSHPQWLVDRVTEQYGTEKAAEFFRYNNTNWPISIRVNTTLTSRDALAAELALEGINVEPGKFDSDSLLVRSLAKGKRLHELKSYLEGLFQIQDESASLIAKLSPPNPGDLVIDLCSAPGGKAVNLACIMHGRGKVLAIDPSPKRLEIVKENLTRQKLENVELAGADGCLFRSEKLADLVLVDAPCSGFGVLGRKADARWNKEPEEPERLHELQLKLLDNAAKLIGPSGRLVYSTCTIDKVENEGTVQAFLKGHPDFELLPVTTLAPILVSPEGYFRTWPPEHKMAGAFGAILARRG